MALLIKNGRIITASDDYIADILCEGEVIAQIAPHLDAPTDADVIDAAGKYVFPGFIDPHVHIYLPFMGTCSKDTYDSASRAALVGGTTSLIEMCCPSREQEPLRSSREITPAFWPYAVCCKFSSDARLRKRYLVNRNSRLRDYEPRRFIG